MGPWTVLAREGRGRLSSLYEQKKEGMRSKEGPKQRGFLEGLRTGSTEERYAPLDHPDPSYFTPAALATAF